MGIGYWLKRAPSDENCWPLTLISTRIVRAVLPSAGGVRQRNTSALASHVAGTSSGSPLAAAAAAEGAKAARTSGSSSNCHESVVSAACIAGGVPSPSRWKRQIGDVASGLSAWPRRSSSVSPARGPLEGKSDEMRGGS